MNWKCWLGIAPLAVLFAVAALLGVTAIVDGDLDPGQPREDLCAQGDSLRAARLIDEAKVTYDRAEENGEDCAHRKRVERSQAKAAERFERGAAYSSVKAPTATSSRRAIDSLAAGLAIDPYEIDASTRLETELRRGLVRPALQCRTGANLTDAGLLDVAGVAAATGLGDGTEACEAVLRRRSRQMARASRRLARARGLDNVPQTRIAYARALQANANLVAARTELEESLDDESRLDRVGAWLAGTPDTLKTAALWLVPLIFALTIVGLLLALGVWVTVRWIAGRSAWARRQCEGLGGHPGLRFFFYKAAVPRVRLGTFEGEGDGDLKGADFAARLKGEIFESTAKGPAFPPDRIETSREPGLADSVSAADLLAEIPATKLLGTIVTFLSKLFRRREIVLSGHLVPRADKGAGVVLCIDGGHKREKSITLWEIVYAPNPGGEGAVRWLRLIPAATMWACWHLSWAQEAAREIDTGPWEVEALVESARAWQLKDEPGRAQALYRAALEADPKQLAVAHNLATIEIHEGDYGRALDRVKWLRKELRSGEQACGRAAEDLRCRWPTLEPASRYTQILALAYLNEGKKARRKDPQLAKAVAIARELVATTTGALDAAEKRETAAQAAATKATRDRWEAKTARRRKKTSAKQATESENRQETEALFKATELPSIVVLASLLARAGDDAVRRDAIASAIADGADVSKIDRDEIHDDQGDLTPSQLIHGYVRRQPNLPRRTHYNLACYYTTLLHFAKCRDRQPLRDLALDSLRIGLIGGELIEWARKDPSLKALQGTQAFNEVLKTRTIEPYVPDPKSPDPKPPAK